MFGLVTMTIPHKGVGEKQILQQIQAFIQFLLAILNHTADETFGNDLGGKQTQCLYYTAEGLRDIISFLHFLKILISYKIERIT